MTAKVLASALSALAALLPAAAPAAELTFVLRIEDGRVPADMRLVRVRQGDVVTLKWSADRRTVVHLHGYDIETVIEPGTEAAMSFTARATGRFTIAPHEAKGSAGHGHGRALVTLEVRPR